MATEVVARPIDRVDDRLKVTGAARYAADAPVEGVAHAVIVQSTVARGRAIIDAAEAERARGVLAVLTPRTMPRLKRVKSDFSGGGVPGGGTMLAEYRLPLEDDAVHHAGQHLAVVVAETLEQARLAASLMRVKYDAERPLLALDDSAATVEEPEQFLGERMTGLFAPLVQARLPIGYVRAASRVVAAPAAYYPGRRLTREHNGV